MSRRLLAALFAFLLSQFSGCSSGDDESQIPIISGVPSRGIVILVKDAATKKGLDGAAATIVSGSYTETVADDSSSADGMSQLIGAWDRAGMYDVTVKRSGYQDETVRGVVVKYNGAYLETVTLTVELRPLAQ